MNNEDDIINSLSWDTRHFFADFIKKFEDKIDTDDTKTFDDDKIYAIDKSDYPAMAAYCQKDKRVNDFNEISPLNYFLDDELFCVMFLYDYISFSSNEIHLNKNLKNIKNMSFIIIPEKVYDITDLLKSNIAKNVESVFVNPMNLLFDSRDNCNAIILRGDHHAIFPTLDALIFGCYKTKIPSSIKIIGNSAFASCKKLTSIDIPDNIQWIYDNAFRDCTNLISIRLSKRLSYLGPFTFEKCSSLKSIELPKQITEIKYSTFLGCRSLESVTFPPSLEFIGNKAFYDCQNLTSIYIPGKVRKIKSDAFGQSLSLASISVDKSNKVFDSRDNSNAIIRTKDHTLILACNETKIPKNILSIGYHAFINCKRIKDIVLPSSLRSIDAFAFYQCNHMEHYFYEGSLYMFNKIEINKKSIVARGW